MATLFKQRNTLVISKTAFNSGIEGIGFVELGVEIVDVALAHLSCAQVEAPAVVVRFQPHIGQHVRELPLLARGRGHRVGRSAAVHHYPFTLLPAVTDVQDVAGLTFEPADLIAPAIARYQAKAGRDVPMESQHPQSMTLKHFWIMEEGQIVKNGVIGRKADVMGQARAGQIDLRLVEQLTRGICDTAGHVRGLIPIIKK